MFPFSAMLCAQQRTQFIGSVAVNADGSGNATLALPAGTAVGDLMIVNTNGHGGGVGGGGSGSWTTSGLLAYKKIATLASVTVTASDPTAGVLLVVVRGPTSIGTPVSPGIGGTYPNLTMSGVTKSSACVGIVWFLGSGAGNDGATSYAMTSPPSAASTARASDIGGSVAGFVEVYPGSYVSGATAFITATGGAAGATYNTTTAFELV